MLKEATPGEYCTHPKLIETYTQDRVLICIVTPLQRLRQKDHKSEASMGYIVQQNIKNKQIKASKQTKLPWDV